MAPIVDLECYVCSGCRIQNLNIAELENVKFASIRTVSHGFH